MNESRVWIIACSIALVTALLRFLPFTVFGGRKVPKLIERLGAMLPYSAMGMLVVYCLKDIKFDSTAGFLPALISCVTVAILYIWKRNTLISVIAGTACYMLLVQAVF